MRSAEKWIIIRQWGSDDVAVAICLLFEFVAKQALNPLYKSTNSNLTIIFNVIFLKFVSLSLIL